MKPGLATFAVILGSICGVACAPDEAPPAASPAPSGFNATRQKAERLITAERILEHVNVLSADAFGGRGPASEGDRMTQAYLVEQLESLGYQPGAADGGWLQPFEIVGIDSEVPATWTFRAGAESQGFRRWDDFVATSNIQESAAVIDEAEVVFVGYGIQAPEYDWDDFKGRDLSGKVLVMLNNDPEWDPELFEGTRRLYYGRWDYKYESAARQGAAGVIIVHTTPSAGYPWQVVQTSWTGEQFQLPAGDEARIAVAAWMTEAAAADLMALGGEDLAALTAAARSREFEPVALGITTSLTLNNALSRVRTANVLGVWPGTDPELAAEAVIYTAHHDHLGTGEPDADGDRIYNGARDNALGVGGVLAIAEAIASLPERPRRSILMLFVAAEEQGLLGSRFYAADPTFAPGRIAANLNYDGGNIWGRTSDVTFIGYGKSTLDAVAERVAAYQGRTVVPDQMADRGYYYRSDQFSFAKIGVPATYFKQGDDFIDRPENWGKERIAAYEAVQYHQPSDEYDAGWILDGAIDDFRMGFWAGLFIADADEMPAWKPGDEFEAAREAALAELEASGL